MATLWIGNFSFEAQLLGRNDQSAFVRRFEAELTPCLAGAASNNDIVLCPQFVDEEFAVRMQQFGLRSIRFLSEDQVLSQAGEIVSIQPWGWSKPIEDITRKLGKHSFPDVEIVRKVNSRGFAFALSGRLGCQLSGERRVESLAEITAAFREASFKHGFVLKSNLGQSGRGQLLSTNSQLNEQQARWIEKKIRVGEPLYLEPMLRKSIEVGIQWDLPEIGDPTLFGITLLETDVRGQYLSSTIGIAPDLVPELDEVLSVQSKAVKEVRAQGYFGPVGIDAMIYEVESGERKIRALQDINARWTMGRLAMHWANRCFPESSAVSWQHCLSRPTEFAVHTSPNHVGGEPVRSHTWCYSESQSDV